MYPCINRGNRDRKFHLRLKGSLGSKQKLASYQIPREKNAVENFPAPSPQEGGWGTTCLECQAHDYHTHKA